MEDYEIIEFDLKELKTEQIFVVSEDNSDVPFIADIPFQSTDEIWILNINDNNLDLDYEKLRNSLDHSNVFDIDNPTRIYLVTDVEMYEGTAVLFTSVYRPKL